MASIFDSTRSIALVGLLLLLPATALSLDVMKMTDQGFEALPKEKIAGLPAIDMLVRDFSRGYKKPFDRGAAIFLIEQALYDLKYYLAIPRGEENPTLTDAIKAFQKNIGSAPTGVLLVKGFETLSEKWSLITPKQVNPPSGKYVKGSTHYAQANGTWVFEKDTQAFPIQTSKIYCSKDSMECESTTAQIASGEQLFLSNDYFKITKWTTDELVAEDDSPLCVSYTLTINFRKEQAHLFRRGKGGKDCTGIADSPQILHLEDGFKVGLEYYKSKDRKALTAYSPEYSKHLRRFYDLMEKRE